MGEAKGGRISRTLALPFPQDICTSGLEVACYVGSVTLRPEFGVIQGQDPVAQMPVFAHLMLTCSCAVQLFPHLSLVGYYPNPACSSLPPSEEGLSNNLLLTILQSLST